MKKTLMSYGFAMAGAAAMVGGLLAAIPLEAEPRTGTGNDRTGTTMNNQGMMASSTLVSTTKPNDDIAPMAGSGMPASNNTYGTTGSDNRRNIRNGQ